MEWEIVSDKSTCLQIRSHWQSSPPRNCFLAKQDSYWLLNQHGYTMSMWPKETVWTKHRRLLTFESRIEILPHLFFFLCSISKFHNWALSSLKRRGLELIQELYLRESSAYLSYRSQSNKYLLSKDTQHTLKLMLHTALEMSVISANVSIAPWLWTALLSLSESCHFPDGTQQEIRTDYTLKGQAARERKAQGRDGWLLLSEVCGHSIVCGENNWMVISNEEKELHLIRHPCL